MQRRKPLGTLVQRQPAKLRANGLGACVEKRLGKRTILRK